MSQVARDMAYASGIAPLGGGSALYNVETSKVMADAILGVTIPIALVVWGFGFFWFVIAVATVLDMAS